MRVSFKRGREQVRFTAHPKKHKTPKQLKKFLFKAGTRRLSTALTKARKVLKRRGWRF